MKGPFTMPICARKQKNRPPGTNQGFSTASSNSQHALSGTREEAMLNFISTTQSYNGFLQHKPYLGVVLET